MANIEQLISEITRLIYILKKVYEEPSNFGLLRRKKKCAEFLRKFPINAYIQIFIYLQAEDVPSKHTYLHYVPAFIFKSIFFSTEIPKDVLYQSHASSL